MIKGHKIFEEMYPCLAAVNRAAKEVPRHDGRVIWLTYEPEGPVEKTLMLVGKGITYDSGNKAYHNLFYSENSNLLFSHFKVVLM